jgi:hypothetical protein
LLHAVQVVREGCTLEADGGGDVPLMRVIPALQRRDDQPHRQRATDLGERVVERPVQQPARARYLEPDRLAVTRHRRTLTPIA